MIFPRFIAYICFALTFPSAFAQSQMLCPLIPGGISTKLNGEYTATYQSNPFSPSVTWTFPGQPYSAEEISQQKKTLADKSSITTPSPSTILYRDSAGRVRTEKPFSPFIITRQAEMPVIPEIFDPVAGYCYILDDANRIAHRVELHKPIRTQLPLQGVPVVTSPDTNKNPDGTASSREDLGRRIIEGVETKGSRSTTTFPVGTQGNENPVSTILETWVSPELNVTILSKISDPRAGETIRALINVSRAEPNSKLFQIPKGYKVVDETGPFTITGIANTKPAY
jgi:hypothetical protein